jgi:hypothetical protein
MYAWGDPDGIAREVDVEQPDGVHEGEERPSKAEEEKIIEIFKGADYTYDFVRLRTISCAICCKSQMRFGVRCSFHSGHESAANRTCDLQQIAHEIARVISP